ncbi:hypothetical protein BU17DRAFT_61061 [Hysterangium stoloniferum]|nr:hypothetical protein BU17DRAFT_61061 [Hysterangium stoloniferum]
MTTVTIDALPSVKSRDEDRSCNLPARILSYIFVIGSQDQVEGDHTDSLSSGACPKKYFAILCSHVCQYWRNVAIGTPQLWSKIILTGSIPYAPSNTGFNSYELSKECIIRSKEAPLDIVVDLTTDEKMSETDIFVVENTKMSLSFFSLISPHVHRWRSFHFCTDFNRAAWVWLGRLSTLRSAPALVFFSLMCHEEWTDEAGKTFSPSELKMFFPLFPEGTPVIKEVVLWGVHVDWSRATFFRGLETLELCWHTQDTRIPYEVFYEALMQSSGLKSLSVQHSGPLVYSWPMDTKIPLVHLETIDLAYIPLDDATNLLDHIDFPVLKNMSLDFEDDSVASFIHATCRPGKQRFGSVETLKLSSFMCIKNEVYMFLSSMPRLVSMTLDFDLVTIGFSQVLVSTPVCPTLSTLKISGLDFCGTWGLQELIRAREARRMPIAKLYLPRQHQYSDFDISWMGVSLKSLELYTPSDEEDDDDDDDEEEEAGFKDHSEGLNGLE